LTQVSQVPEVPTRLVQVVVARNSEDNLTQRPIIKKLFINDAIALVVTLVITLSGSLNILGWGIVAVYLFFAVFFGYLLLPKGEIA